MVHIKNTLKKKNKQKRDPHGFPFPPSFPIISGELLQDKVEEELSQKLTEAPLLFSSKLLGCQFTIGHRSILGLPLGLGWKRIHLQCRRPIRFLGWEDPLEKGKAPPLQYSDLEKFMDYSSWGRQESDTTEQLS